MDVKTNRPPVELHTLILGPNTVDYHYIALSLRILCYEYLEAVEDRLMTKQRSEKPSREAVSTHFKW